jgi:ABC-type branched-subunit amino acid transport system substrate-binding protein
VKHLDNGDQMTNRPHRARWFARSALLVTLALVASACGGDDDVQSDDAAPSTTTADVAASCPGDPIKVTSIQALTGPLAITGPAADMGFKAAVQAVNSECALGRPIEVNVCDDESDVNASIACGREAKDGGSLAIVGSVGSYDDGANAAGLPAVYLNGTSAFELTSENAYSSASGLMLAMSAISAAKAQGAEKFLMVFPDVAALQFASTQMEKLAEIVGVEYDVVFFPSDTTDFAPLAAQITERDPDALGLVPLNAVPFVNAITSEGITTEDRLLCYPSGIFSAEQLDELGDVMNGACFVSQTMPPTETGNDGVAEFREDMEAAGYDPDDPEVEFASVTAWSTVKRLEAALLTLDPDAIAALDSSALLDAVVANPIERSETAQYDFRDHQLPEFPEMEAFRIFTRHVAILQLNDEVYTPLTDGFVDVTEPPDLG